MPNNTPDMGNQYFQIFENLKLLKDSKFKLHNNTFCGKVIKIILDTEEF